MDFVVCSGKCLYLQVILKDHREVVLLLSFETSSYKKCISLNTVETLAHLIKYNYDINCTVL